MGVAYGLIIPGCLPLAIITQLGASLEKQFGPGFSVIRVSPHDVELSGGSLTYLPDARQLIRSFGIHPPATIILLPAPKDRAESAFKTILRLCHRFISSEPVPEHQFVWVDGYPYHRTLSSDEMANTTYHGSRAIFGKTIPSDVPEEPIRIRQSDLVLDGVEIGGGGERECHAERFQHNLAVAKVSSPARYDYHAEALLFGAPPVFAFGIGWDRLMWKMFGTKRLADVIYFPKNSEGMCQVSGVPRGLSQL